MCIPLSLRALPWSREGSKRFKCGLIYGPILQGIGLLV
jgi:hypothetical protein